jgi:hypothetical protein
LWRSPLIVAVTPHCGSHPSLWRSPLIATASPHCDDKDSSPLILMASLRKNYRSPIFFGGTLHPNTTTITYEIAEPADSAVTCSGSKCCLVNSLFVLACASLTKIRPVTMIAMREVMKNGLHHGQNCPRLPTIYLHPINTTTYGIYRSILVSRHRRMSRQTSRRTSSSLSAS